MRTGLFRVGVRGEAERLARGDPETGPRELLPIDLSLDDALAGPADRFGDAVRTAPGSALAAPWRILAPVASQEVWAAGVTYRRSRDARIEEALEPTPYDRLYLADRPELFFKAPGWRVRGPGEAIGVRRDSAWDVPEPELALVLAADLGLAGYAIGNDVSSRSIEGENPLYLPQAKVYEGSCALGPCIVPADEVDGPFEISLQVRRHGGVIAEGAATTAQMRRTFDELARYLGRALRFPAGAILLTGTGIVPDPGFTLRAGDVVRIGIKGLGVLENPVEEVGRAGPDGFLPTEPR